MSNVKGIGGGLTGLLSLGCSIYAIGKVHGYINISIFILVSFLALYLVYRFVGSRKKKQEVIIYNLNETFILTVLIFILLMGLYSCYRIYQSESELGETIAEYAITWVLVVVVFLPGFFAYSFLSNRNDKLTITTNTLSILDDKNIFEFNLFDIISYQIKGSKLVLKLKEKEKKEFDLSEINLSSTDIKKLDLDLQERLKKEE